jgi:flagellar biosynthesis anti-sigma factor FlgM
MIEATRAGGLADPAALGRTPSALPPADAAAPSGRAGATAQVRRVEAGPPPVDEAKVARLAADIAAGTYRIDADAIAGAMIAELAPAATR